ncbi:MAG: DUF115 domain-containing protein [Lachnospiraceae bacterium]|nr:DUF115 domain-containing protein [Lachnospiraceae bacterium]
MAEDFIEEIYKSADLICALRQCGEYIKVRDYTEFSKLWRTTANVLTEIINSYIETNREKAMEMYKKSQAFTGATDNIYTAGDVLDNELIPEIYEYNKQFCGIDVTEGKWRIHSSRSGFLTIYNTETERYLHSIDNPLWDEIVRARYYYRGVYDKAYILGLGLGYFPYALWKESKGSAEIYVYENNKELVDYARLYGVLDRIPDDKLHIIVNENVDELVISFLEQRKNDETEEFVYVSDGFVNELTDNTVQIVSTLKSEAETECNFEKPYEINYYRNKRKFTGYFSELEPQAGKDEYIIVAAGPSLDDKIEYLKDNIGKKVIIAVNTVLRRLLKEGIKPNFVCVLDPTDGIYAHIKGIGEDTRDIPLIAESTTYWGYIDAYRGPIYKVLGSGYGPVRDEAAVRPDDVFYLGGTVTSLALEIAIKNNAKQIEFVGLDLGTPGNKLYAGNIVETENNDYNKHYTVPATDGGVVDTADTYLIFKEFIEGQISNNPQIAYVNLSEHGSHILGTVCGPWKNCIKIDEIYEAAAGSDDIYKGLLCVATALSDIYVGMDLDIRDDYFAAANELSAEAVNLLNKWRAYAEEIGSVRGGVYIDSVLSELKASTKNTLKLLDDVIRAGLSKEELYFVYAQVREKISLGKYVTDAMVSDKMAEIKDTITNLYRKEINISDGGSNANKNLYYYIVPEIVGASDKLLIIKNDCKRHIATKRNVLLINSSEKIPFKGTVRLFNSIVKNDEEEYFSKETINYEGVSIPYFQCEAIMPDAGNIKIVLESILKSNPDKVISADDGPLTWLIQNYREVEIV